jgi:predicted nucleotidyltransferase/HEPN domain-containing protein
MKTELDHLPIHKQEQLRAITAIFGGAPIDMLILFGSHARGDWVEDSETGYVSDYDLMAVVETEKQAADLTLWSELEQQARAVAGRTPLTFIVHDIKFLNSEIRCGNYFFADVANEGVMLHDTRHFSLAKPKALNATERLALAERNFANWFDSASEFWRGCRYYASRNLLKHAAFLLHQATERYYHAALLVFTGYKERTHDIEQLGNLAGAQHPLLLDVLPKSEPGDKRLFELLKKAYIDARYSMSYRITPEELTVLQERVVILGERVRAACLEKIATFCGPESVNQNLPMPPQLQEPLLANLPPPPSNAAEFTQWAGSLIELSEQRGIAKGEAVGIAKGEVESRAADILMVLRTRGVDVSEEVEQRILTCADPAVLSRWLQRAVTVSEAIEVIAA